MFSHLMTHIGTTTIITNTDQFNELYLCQHKIIICLSRSQWQACNVFVRRWKYL